MMELYDEWTLPIFPIDNHFSSAFISFGEKAYFLTFEKDRPKGMPPICLFSELNHPPSRDFIKHLPYSLSDSQRLGGKVQGYSSGQVPTRISRRFKPALALTELPKGQFCLVMPLRANGRRMPSISQLHLTGTLNHSISPDVRLIHRTRPS